MRKISHFIAIAFLLMGTISSAQTDMDAIMMEKNALCITFSAAAATIPGHIIPSRAATYEEMAQEAALSRLYGSIHFRSDL